MEKIMENLDLYLNMKESLHVLNEALIQFGSNSNTKFGNVVIMAGGAGSGKGFVLQNLVGIEGKVLDVDALKTAAMKSEKINKIVKEETGYDLKTFNLKNPDDVFKLHDVVSSHLNLPNKQQNVLFSSILSSDPSRKPNIIFDVTLKDLQKLNEITRNVEELGYEKKNIHIVWVVNDIEVAKQQNLNRSRTVPEEILVNTHRGVSQTMADIVNSGENLKRYMDGFIYFVFNKAKVDSELSKSDSGGFYIKKANYVMIKQQGKPVRGISEIEKSVLNKIKEYTPSSHVWA